MKALFLGLGLALSAPVLAFSTRPISASDPPTLRVTLSAPQATLRDPDDSVDVTVEIHNDTSEDVYVSHLLVAFENAPAELVFEVSDSAGQTFKCESLNMTLSERTVREWWTKIAPNHFYGSQIKLNASTCRRLATPGDYTLLAKYASRGGTIPANPEWNTPAHLVWKGEVSSNSISVHVASKRNRQGNK